MERCPICRARFKGAAVCYRCGTDLTILLRIEAQAAALEQRAVAWLAAGDAATARQTAQQALALQRRPLAQALVGFLRCEQAVQTLSATADEATRELGATADEAVQTLSAAADVLPSD